MLPLNLSDTAATGQDGSSLEFIAAIASRQCYIQDASGRGLWGIKGGILAIFDGFRILSGLLLTFPRGVSGKKYPNLRLTFSHKKP